MEKLAIEILIWLISWFILFKMMKPFEEIKIYKEHYGNIQRWSSSARAGGSGMVFDKERGVGVKNAVSADECQSRADKLMNTDVDKVIFRKTFLKSLLLSYLIFFPLVFSFKLFLL
tara:strand:- start:707 stop:1054 length:348 start_codon:yes stop_codon:yes gene_type:complete